MSDQPTAETSPSQPTTAPGAPPSSAVPMPPPAATASTETAAQSPGAANALTPEEQMALFEKDLKENDWGHQPC